VRNKLYFEKVSNYINEQNISIIDKIDAKLFNISNIGHFKCEICNYCWSERYEILYNRKYCCRNCSEHIIRSKYKKKYTIDDARQIFLNLNLELLDIQILTVIDKYNVKCLICGYITQKRLYSAIAGHGCRNCFGKCTFTIEFVRQYCLSLNIECMSDIYENKDKKLLFKCLKCHKEWSTTFGSIYNAQSGCPNCFKYKGENLVLSIFEEITGYKFVKQRHDWIRNPLTNYSLELDGYCAELKLAVEYQGYQHYGLVKKFKQTQQQLESQKYRDNYKKQACKENNVCLLIVPQLGIIKRDRVKQYIENILYNQFYSRR